MGPIKYVDMNDKRYGRRWSINSIDSDYDVSDLSVSANYRSATNNLSVMGNIQEMSETQQELWLATNAGDLIQVQNILEENVDVNFIHSSFGNSPLHVAVENGHMEVVKELLRQGIYCLRVVK